MSYADVIRNDARVGTFTDTSHADFMGSVEE